MTELTLLGEQVEWPAKLSQDTSELDLKSINIHNYLILISHVNARLHYNICFLIHSCLRPRHFYRTVMIKKRTQLTPPFIMGLLPPYTRRAVKVRPYCEHRFWCQKGHYYAPTGNG